MEMNGDKPVTKKELQDELKGVHATMDRVAGDIRAEMVTKTELKEELKGVHATIDRVAGDIRAEMVTKTEWKEELKGIRGAINRIAGDQVKMRAVMVTKSDLRPLQDGIGQIRDSVHKIVEGLDAQKKKTTLHWGRLEEHDKSLKDHASRLKRLERDT